MVSENIYITNTNSFPQSLYHLLQSQQRPDYCFHVHTHAFTSVYSGSEQTPSPASSTPNYIPTTKLNSTQRPIASLQPTQSLQQLSYSTHSLSIHSHPFILSSTIFL